MRARLLFLTFARCLSHWLRRSQKSIGAPKFEIVTADQPEPMPFSISPKLRPAPAFEGPPLLTRSANGAAFFTTTSFSWLCRVKGNFLKDTQTLGPDNCNYFSGTERFDPKTGVDAEPAAVAQKDKDWELSYSGAMSVVALTKPLDGFDHIVALHGENKNERFGDKLYANTVNRDVRPDACASGYTKGIYNDCWQAYNGFVSLVLYNATTGARRELGPIVWPAMGYTHDGRKTSYGLRQPSLFLADPYLYIYYADTSQGLEAERRPGFRVARIDLSRPDAATAPVALPYTLHGFADDNPSLPKGFDKASIRNFYDAQGGRSVELWRDSWKSGCLRIARIKDTPYYLGAEDYGDATGWGVRLRLSADLVHWSDPVPVPGAAADYNSGVLHYPVPLSAAGNSQEVIDAADFYLLGSTAKGTVVRRRLSLRLLN